MRPRVFSCLIPPGVTHVVYSSTHAFSLILTLLELSEVNHRTV